MTCIKLDAEPQYVLLNGQVVCTALNDLHSNDLPPARDVLLAWNVLIMLVQSIEMKLSLLVLLAC